MIESADYKINRARALIEELGSHLYSNPHFEYILITNIVKRQKTVRSRKNDRSVKQAALIAGDLVHNLRSALDHAYWHIVSPHAQNESDKRQIQFPYSKNKKDLIAEAKRRRADRVGPKFLQQVIDLAPYEDHGGNENLVALNYLDKVDKHRMLPFAGNLRRFRGDELKNDIGFRLMPITILGDGDRPFVTYGYEPSSEELQDTRFDADGVREDVLQERCDLVISTAGKTNPVEILSLMQDLIDTVENSVALLESGSVT